jgi:hypothetical protein
MPTQPNLTHTGIPYIYKAVYPSGFTKYLLKYSRAGFSKKVSFPFTPQGLKDAENALPKAEEAFRKFAKEKGVVDPSIKKLTHPVDPKKPWRYQRANKPTEYFATEAKAEAFRDKAVSAKIEGQTKLPKTAFPAIKTRIIAGETLEDIATTYKLKNVGNIRTLLAQNNTTYSDLSPHDSYLKDAKSLKYIKDNYGKLKGETMANKLYPTLDSTTALSRVRSLVSKLISEKKIKEVPASLIEEVRIEHGYNPEESAKKVQKVRKAKIKKFSVPAFERAMSGTHGSPLSHMDDLATQIVRFETLGYSPQKINAEILKNVDPYFKSLYEKRDTLLKNKPKGYVKLVNAINDKGAAVAYGTKGYKSFKIEEPLTGRTYRLGLDASKSIDPFGQFEGKTIQGVSPKKIKKTSKTMTQVIPDPVERYLFLENAKRVRQAQSRVPKREISKVIKNLTQLGFDTDPYKKRLVDLVSKLKGGARKRVCGIGTKVLDGLAAGGRVGYKAAGVVDSCPIIPALESAPEQTMNELSKLRSQTGVLGRIGNTAKGFLGALGKFGPAAGKYGAIAAAGAIAQPLVKQFMNDDPSTYLTDEHQQAGMLDALIEGERPKPRSEILDWGMGAGTLGTTAAAVPGSGALYKYRRGLSEAKIPKAGPITESGLTAGDYLSKHAGKDYGKLRAGAGVGMKLLSGMFTPAGLLATEPLRIAQKRREGESWGDIATSPMTWMGPAFAPSMTKLATAGMKKGSLLPKLLRLGISSSRLAAMGPAGWAALVASLGWEGMKQYGDYKRNRGFFASEDRLQT